MLSNERRLQHFDHAHKNHEANASPMMRAFNPHSGGEADGKPSKLELMRADYQRRLLKEKEEKMIQLYEDNHKKVMTRMVRAGGGAASRNAQNGATGTGSGKSVRDLFNERRRVEAKELSATSSPYRQTKELSSPQDWPGKTDSSNTAKKQKSSAGRDRSQPLAPIRRPPDTQEMGNPTRSGIPQRFPVPPPDNGDGNPFPGRPRLVKHKPLPPTGKLLVDNRNNIGAGDSNMTQSPSSAHKLMTRNSPQVTQNKIEKFSGERLPPRAPERLTDFQKWQAEQGQAREERLKKLNSLRNANTGSEGRWNQSDDDESADDRQNVKGKTGGNSGSPGGNNLDEKMKAKEQELLEKIAKRQRELEEMKKDREIPDDEEQYKTERKKTQQVTERQKTDDARRKEELKRFKQEENENRLEIHRAEQHRMYEDEEWRENETRIKEEDKRQFNQVSTKSRRQKEEATQDREQLSSKSEDSPHPAAKTSGSTPKVSKNPQPSRSKTDPADLDERRLSLSDAHVYEQAAASLEAQALVADLATCRICGRSFVQDRLKKHQEACAKAHKPRKEFDSAKKRVEGTDLAKYASKSKRREPPVKKSNWRAKHEEFIQTLRHAKKVTQCEKEGGDLRNLTPPPASVNPDYVACPHCGRTFNETAAERHIPRCQSLKTRPPPVRGKRR